MKKVFLVLAVASMSLVACKKDFTCTCDIAGVKTSTPINDVKKADAEDACDALNTAASIAGGKCELE